MIIFAQDISNKELQTIIYKELKTQEEKKKKRKLSKQKMDRRHEQILYQRHMQMQIGTRKMFNITSHEKNANENMIVITAPHLLKLLVNITHSKNITVGKRQLSYTAGGNVNRIATQVRQFDRFYRSKT